MRILFALGVAAALLAAADLRLGKPLTLKEPVPIAVVLAKPDNYVGKPLQIKGKIAEVCQEMGCWMVLADGDGKTLRIKVNDGEIVFPKDSAGKTAVAEGNFVKQELTREQAIEQARESAKDSGKPFDPSSIKSGKTVYQIQGTGAVILGN
jgi:hypothetical protein